MISLGRIHIYIKPSLYFETSFLLISPVLQLHLSKKKKYIHSFKSGHVYVFYNKLTFLDQFTDSKYLRDCISNHVLSVLQPTVVWPNLMQINRHKM